MLELLEEAIVAAVRALRDSQGGGALEGFAICTDEDLSSLYAAGFTAEEGAQHTGEYHYRYCPAEWPEELASFERASKAFGELAAARRAESAGEEWKQSVLGQVVDVLQSHRERETFGAAALVAFVSHDCGDPFFAWMDAGVKALNSPSLYAKWREYY